ncbi:AbrB/MazE/SpoVT family DNA-binding domain-containing protein [Rickettsia endosymbiont of Rhinocyllus conicus]|uniref:AbrB/MazE/SpoVT family DNA-binding domain-containing protein n=1 Tax=Rickettsia endosymbiont of Rhinocyllus conicus TaxID=3066252 RepID=UPI001E0E55E4|nr:AbrB/MazE/SpoVT family DNA-binding domain-containing protein [Rickettsia endosymbiont of Bembidion lapponicum]
MIVQKSYIDNNGRLAIPIKVRKKLKLKTGDEVTIKYNDSELIVSTFHSNIEKARNILDKYKNIDLNKELKLMRKYDSDVIPAEAGIQKNNKKY